jgi:hypothetical protein
LEGYAQYIVKGRYDEQTILREVISESADAKRLSDGIAGVPEAASRDARMALGELIVNALEAKRAMDTKSVLAQLEDIARQVNVREPTHELDAVNLAVLANVDEQDRLQETVDELGKQWGGRVELRLLGPLAAYDFVVTRSAAV